MAQLNIGEKINHFYKILLGEIADNFYRVDENREANGEKFFLNKMHPLSDRMAELTKLSDANKWGLGEVTKALKDPDGVYRPRVVAFAEIYEGKPTGNVYLIEPKNQ